MGKLQLRDGHFYRDGHIVPPVIGDAEQISLLQRRERDMERQQETGCQCEFVAEHIEFEAIVKFDCVCGEKVRKSDWACEADYADEDTAMDVWDGKTIKCPACGLRYVIDGRYAKID